MSRADVESGVRTRAVLLRIAAMCLERRCILPRHADIGRALHIDQSQISRHWGVLADTGAIERVRAGTRHGVRYRIKAIREESA